MLKNMQKQKMHYTVYLSKTDEIVAFGSADECAKTMEMNKKTFISIVSKSLRQGRTKYTILKEIISIGAD